MLVRGGELNQLGMGQLKKEETGDKVLMRFGFSRYGPWLEVTV